MIIEEEGAYLKGESFVGEVLILADNVTLEGCTVDANGASYGVNVGVLTRGARLLGCDISGASRKGVLAAWTRVEGGVIHHCGEDGIFMGERGHLAVVGVLFHSLGDETLYSGTQVPHADGVQVAAGRAFVVRKNYFDLAPKPGFVTNACVFIESSLGRVSEGWVVENVMSGGNYCIYVKAEATKPENGTPRNINLIANDLSDYEFGPMFLSNPDLVKVT